LHANFEKADLLVPEMVEELVIDGKVCGPFVGYFAAMRAKNVAETIGHL
jgi:hypothetical protein